MPIRPPTAKLPEIKTPVAKSRNHSSDIDRWYHHVAWFRCRDTAKAYNPRCQRLDLEGNQCQEPATKVHHLVSPYADKSLFYDWRNLVCVCEDHHPYGPGEPLNKSNRYVITQGMFGATVEPNEIIRRLQQGERPFSI